MTAGATQVTLDDGPLTTVAFVAVRAGDIWVEPRNDRQDRLQEVGREVGRSQGERHARCGRGLG